MSDPLDRFERLAAHARQADAAVAAPGVSADVLRQLRTLPEAPDRPLWWVAAGSMVAALLVLGINLPAFFESPEMAVELAVYTSWIML